MPMIDDISKAPARELHLAEGRRDLDQVPRPASALPNLATTPRDGGLATAEDARHGDGKSDPLQLAPAAGTIAPPSSIRSGGREDGEPHP